VGPIELLDELGNVVSRIHIAWRRRDFKAGEPILEENLRPQLGYLLEKYLAANPEVRKVMATMIEHCTNAAVREGDLDDTLLYMARCLEGFARSKGIATQHLLSELAPDLAESVERILSDAQDRLLSLQSPDEKIIQRIAGRVRSAAEKDYSFGTIVCKILDAYGLPDAAVMKRWPGDLGEWSWLINRVRSEVAHEGFIDLDSTITPINAFLLSRHLRDIAIRIILLELGFEGDYQPPVARERCLKPLRWVVPETLPDAFGF